MAGKRVCSHRHHPTCGMSKRRANVRPLAAVSLQAVPGGKPQAASASCHERRAPREPARGLDKGAMPNFRVICPTDCHKTDRCRCRPSAAAVGQALR